MKNIFITLLIILLIVYILLNSPKLEPNYQISDNYNINFTDILPKINKTYKNIYNSNIDDIFNSKQLFINDVNITINYIKYIREIREKNNEINKYNIINKNEIKFNLNYFKSKEEKFNYTLYGKFCVEENLLESNITKDNIPLISIIAPNYNKSNVIMKSIRSIQNQSFKNIEIIIVDDCSPDNSSLYYNYLLETDPRIRIFTHIKNMGVWRSRLDGFLYSRGKYIIHFDIGDLYSDPFVLEDAYNLIEKYKLDSVKMMFTLIFNYSEIENSIFPFIFNSNYTKIVYESQNILKYNREIFSTWGNIWTRLTRSSIITKGLSLLNSKILNIYKNLWEDLWWNRLIDEASYSFLIINRNAYLYYKDFNGEGDIKIDTDVQKKNIIFEFIQFLYFDLIFLPKENNKNEIIYKLYQYTKNKEINLVFLNSNFDVLNNLLITLIKDTYVSNIKKVFLKRLLKESMNK